MSENQSGFPQDWSHSLPPGPLIRTHFCLCYESLQTCWTPRVPRAFLCPPNQCPAAAHVPHLPHLLHHLTGDPGAQYFRVGFTSRRRNWVLGEAGWTLEFVCWFVLLFLLLPVFLLENHLSTYFQHFHGGIHPTPTLQRTANDLGLTSSFPPFQ